MKCELCGGSGWYGDNGPGLNGNEENYRCSCGTAEKCTNGHHRLTDCGFVQWCEICNREGDTDVCRMQAIPKAEGEE